MLNVDFVEIFRRKESDSAFKCRPYSSKIVDEEENLVDI